MRPCPRACPREGAAADQSDLLALKDVTQWQSFCLTGLISRPFIEEKSQKNTLESAPHFIQLTNSWQANMPLAL